MKNENEIEALFEIIELPESGRKFVRKTRASETSRSVTEGCFQNLSSLIYSEKMGNTIQSESATGETAAICEYEIEDSVFEYYDQLPPLRVNGVNRNGRISSWTTTPDFLVIREDGIYVEEIKSDTYIQKKLEEQHPAWKRDINGEIHYLPLEDHFSEMGIRYRVRPVSTFNKKLFLNRQLLLASRREKSPDEIFIRKVRKCLEKSFSKSMKELMDDLKVDDATPFIQLVDQEIIFCELDKELLGDYENINLALTRELSAQAREIREQAKKGINMMGVVVDGLPSKEYADDTLRKLRIIESGDKGRSTRRWIKKIKDGHKVGLSPFQSLLSKKIKSGNRSNRLPAEVIEAFEQAVDLYYAKETRPNITSAFNRYRIYSQKRHPDVPPMSEKTFRLRLSKLNQMRIGYKRGGKRMMYSNSSTSDVLHRSLKAGLAFQRAHIDHHVVKCFLSWGSDGDVDYIGRVWLSLLIDEATDMVLGYHFSFAKPSRLADGCVLRDCVRRYGMLPEEIIADHGSDFKSVYFRSLLASEKVTLTFRPKSASKYGSEVERFFNEFQTQWLCQREGNMVDKHAVRAVDGKFSAKSHTVLNPQDLLWEFDQFIAHRNTKLRGNSTTTIESSFSSSLKTYGCMGRNVEFDERFIIATAVESKEFSIERNDVKIDGIRYSSPELVHAKSVKSSVEIRIEPENPYIVYAYIKGRWVTCVAAGAVEFMEKSSVNQRVETLKIRGAGSLRQLAKSHSSESLAFLLDKADERLLEQRKYGLVEYDEDNIANEEINLFDQISCVELHDLPTTTWSQS